MEKNNLKEILFDAGKNFKEMSEFLKEQSKNLQAQNKALYDNIVNKDCKSNIYDRISDTNKRIDKVENTLYSNELGREGIVKMLIDIKEGQKEQQKATIENNALKKHIGWLWAFVGGGGITIITNFII